MSEMLWNICLIKAWRGSHIWRFRLAWHRGPGHAIGWWSIGRLHWVWFGNDDHKLLYNYHHSRRAVK